MLNETYLYKKYYMSAVLDLADAIEAAMDHPEVVKCLEELELQPTGRAKELAAACAVNCLLAHDIGQEANETQEPEEPQEGRTPRVTNY